MIMCMCLASKAYALDVVFRFDDFRLREDSLQEQMLKIFEKNRIPLSIAVVPYNSDGTICYDSSYSSELAVLNRLCDEGLLEVALHGFSHSLRSVNGEFGGVSYNEQEELLSKGQAALSSLFKKKIVSFIPPWNNYDSNTLEILDSLGFKVISSCLTAGQVLSNVNLEYYPTSVGTFNAFSSFRKALEKNTKCSGQMVFMFHSYDFDDFTMEDLDELLSEVSSMKDVNCYTFSQLLEKSVKSDSHRVEANIEVNLLTKILGTGTVILPTWLAWLIRIVNMLIYLIGTFVWCLFVGMVVKDGSRHMMCCYTLLTVFSIACIWFHLWTPLKTALALFVTPLIWCGATIIFRKVKDRT